MCVNVYPYRSPVTYIRENNYCLHTEYICERERNSFTQGVGIGMKQRVAEQGEVE